MILFEGLYRAVAAYTSELQRQIHAGGTKSLRELKLKFEQFHAEMHKDFLAGKDTYPYWSERLGEEPGFAAFMEKQAEV